MNELALYRILTGGGAVILIAAAVWMLRLSPANLKRFEPWPRNRLFGLILGWLALILCIAPARVVSPQFLLPLLWPLALIFPVLCYLFVDYLLARSVGGLLILAAYYLVHASFTLHTPVLAPLALIAWIFGIAGIWVSAKPCALRDWIRLLARAGHWRWISAALSLAYALFLVLAAILTPGRMPNGL